MSGLESSSGLLLADRCRREISDYWKRQGRSVDVWIDPVRAPQTVREATIYPLQSNLKNGWPEGKA